MRIAFCRQACDNDFMKDIAHSPVKTGAEKKKNQPQASDPSGLDAMLCFAIYGAAHAFTRAYKPLLEPLGLTYPQYLAMMALWSEDSQKVKALGDRLGLDSGTLSPLLKRLEQAGLVARRRDPEDERQVIVSLTPEGIEMQERSSGVMADIGKATGCSLDEVAALREALVGLKERLERAEKG
jgi:MarR family transcriptional regulator, organic hydroperoxide resistance regulator